MTDNLADLSARYGEKGTDMEKVNAATPKYEFRGTIVDRDLIMKEVRLRTAHKWMDRELIMKMPHTMVCDIPIIMHVWVGKASLLVNEDLLRAFSIDAGELMKTAFRNTAEKSDFSFTTLSAKCGEPLVDDPVKVVTTKNFMFGAAAIAIEPMLMAFARSLNDDFYIIPSSVHELMILPKGKAMMTVPEMERMVYLINRTEVNAQDVLSDNVYEFCRNASEGNRVRKAE